MTKQQKNMTKQRETAYNRTGNEFELKEMTTKVKELLNKLKGQIVRNRHKRTGND